MHLALTNSFLSFQKLYKAKFEKEKGKSVYNNMIVPPDVQHAMAVAKNQSSVSHLHDDIVFVVSQPLIAHISLLMCLSVFATYCILSALLLNPTGFLQEGCQSQPALH